MNFTTYSTAKAAGQVAVAKLNDSYVLSVKKFNPGTGEAIAPEVQAVDSSKVQAQIVALQGQLDSLSALLADLEALG